VKDRRFIWLAVVPAALGGIAALLLSAFGPPYPLHRVVLFGDWAGLFLGAGLFLAVVLALVLTALWVGGVWGWNRGAVTRREQARERERFYGRLHHETKNPLTVLYTSLDRMAREQLTPAGRESARNARGQVRHLALLVENLRKVAGVATRQMDRQDVDMAELVEATVAAVRDRQAAQADGALNLHLHLDKTTWKPAVVYGDPDLLAQAFHNVIENAVKYSPPGSPVEVWCQTDGDWVRVKVVDQGCGMTDEDLRRLGQELFRSDATAASVPGYGLGLAMVWAILERHGGEVSAESRVGKGTAVTLLLPLAGRLPAKEKKR
jgi:two-component system OmpR family sensor kinase